MSSLELDMNSDSFLYDLVKQKLNSERFEMEEAHLNRLRV